MNGASGPYHERDRVTEPEWWLYQWRTNHSSQAQRSIVTTTAGHRSDRAGYTVDAHPSSTVLAKVLTELDNVHTVVAERALTATERIEVIEDLASVFESNHLMTYRGWHADGSRIWAHPNLQVAQATMDTAQRELRTLRDRLLTEHGEYEPDDNSFPPIDPLRELLETAHLAADGAGDMTDQQLSEVAAWLAEIAHICAAIVVRIARRGDPEHEALWQAATKATEAFLALYECTLPAAPARAGEPRRRQPRTPASSCMVGRPW